MSSSSHCRLDFDHHPTQIQPHSRSSPPTPPPPLLPQLPQPGLQTQPSIQFCPSLSPGPIHPFQHQQHLLLLLLPPYHSDYRQHHFLLLLPSSSSQILHLDFTTTSLRVSIADIVFLSILAWSSSSTSNPSSFRQLNSNPPPLKRGIREVKKENLGGEIREVEEGISGGGRRKFGRRNLRGGGREFGRRKWEGNLRGGRGEFGRMRGIWEEEFERWRKGIWEEKGGRRRGIWEEEFERWRRKIWEEGGGGRRKEEEMGIRERDKSVNSV